MNDVPSLFVMFLRWERRKKFDCGLLHSEQGVESKVKIFVQETIVSKKTWDLCLCCGGHCEIDVFVEFAFFDFVL